MATMTKVEQRLLMKLPEEVRREKIIQEVARRTKEDGYGFLNNFYSNLPNERIQPGGGDRRNIAIKTGVMDMKYGDFLNEEGETKKKYASDLRLSQTPREFYATIDKALLDTHVAMSTLLDLQATFHEMATAGPHYSEKQMTKMIAIQNQISEMILQAYIELRVIGYTHNDLAD